MGSPVRVDRAVGAARGGAVPSTSTALAAIDGGHGPSGDDDPFPEGSSQVLITTRSDPLPSVLDAQEAERRRIARDLHDVVGQALLAARISVQAAQVTLVPGSDLVPRTEGASRLNAAVAAIDDAIHAVRSFAVELRPSALDDLGLLPAVRSLLVRASAEGGYATELTVGNEPWLVDPNVETACFRIVQEALMNVRRHAGARTVSVFLGAAGNRLELRIRDDGIGFCAKEVERRTRSGQHLGLIGMQERALSVGGAIAVRSAVGFGTEVTAWFPLSRAARPDLKVLGRTSFRPRAIGRVSREAMAAGSRRSSRSAHRAG